MSSKGGSTRPAGTTTTTSTSAPWTGQQSYLETGFNAAKNLYVDPAFAPEYYPYETYAPNTYWQNQGITDYGNMGSRLNYNAIYPETFMNDVLQGDYLNANPALTPLQDLSRYNLGTYGAGYDTLRGLATGASPTQIASLTNLGASNPYGGEPYNVLADMALGRNQYQLTPSAQDTLSALYGANPLSNSGALAWLESAQRGGQGFDLSGASSDYLNRTAAGTNPMNAGYASPLYDVAAGNRNLASYGQGNLLGLAGGANPINAGYAGPLYDVAAGNRNLSSYGQGSLLDLAGINAGDEILTTGYGQNLRNIAAGGRGPFYGSANDWANNELTNSSYYGAGVNPAFTNLSNLGTGVSNPVAGAGSDYLGRTATSQNLAASAPGYSALSDVATGRSNALEGSAGSGYLNWLLGEGSGNATLMQDNLGARTLEDFSTGKEKNTYLKDLSKSVLADVLPGIQSQFVKGGGLSSPQAAYASSQGATAALAPVLNDAFQAEQRNQLAAADRLSTQYLQDWQLKGDVAVQEERDRLAAQDARTKAAADQASLLLQGQGNQTTAAQQLINAQLGAGNLQLGAGTALGDQLLTGRGQLSDLSQSRIASQQAAVDAEARAGTSLADQYLRGAGIRSDAATSAQQGQLGLFGNQVTAGTALGDQWLRGIGLQSDAAAAAQQGQLGLYGNQVTAGGTLGDQWLQGIGAQTDAAKAQQLADLGLLDTRSRMGIATGDQWLQGAGLQESAADAQLRADLGFLSNQQAAGSALGTNFLSGRNLQQDALNQALTGDLARQSVMYNAGNALSQNAISGGGLQGDLLSTLSTTYGQGLTQMLAALSSYPDVAQSLLLGPQAEYDIGATQQTLDQAKINDALQRWNYQETLPYQQLNEYLGQISGSYGNSSTTTSPYYLNQSANLASGLLGGSLLGGAAASTFGAPTWLGGALGAGLSLV